MHCPLRSDLWVTGKRAAWSAVLLGTLVLTGCGADPEPSRPEELSPASDQEKSDSPSSAREAYAQALERLMSDHILPDGTDRSADFDPMYGNERVDIGKNQFAVADVDGDGTEELVIQYLSTDGAGKRGLVSSWDSEDGLSTAVFANSSLTFYENGAVREDWGHNQGRSGRQWPFFLYRYLPQTDSYEEVGALEVWDIRVCEDDFPRETDTSGSGMVYYIYPAELDASQWDMVEPVDRSVYQIWLDETLQGSPERALTYFPLTEENIRQICQE